jgi:hypothetical protein
MGLVMKIYIHPLKNHEYLSKMIPYLNYIGIDTTTDINDNYDDAFVDVRTVIPIRQNFKSRGLPTVRFDMLDALLMHNVLVDIGYPTIPTIQPLTLQDVQLFFDTYGTFIIKPRISMGSVGLYSFHYKNYSNMDDFIADISTASDFWETQQNTDEYSIDKMLYKQSIIQQYITETSSSSNITKVIGEIGPANSSTQNFNYTIVPKTYFVDSNVQNVNLQDISTLRQNAPLYSSMPTRSAEVDTPSIQYDAFIRNFFTLTGIDKTFFQIDILEHNGIQYIIDIAWVPIKGIIVFEDADKKPYLLDRLKFIYGKTTELQYKFAPLFIWKDFTIPAPGLTPLIRETIQNSNVQLAYNYTLPNLTKFACIIRGNTPADIDVEINRLTDYIATLPTP